VPLWVQSSKAVSISISLLVATTGGNDNMDNEGNGCGVSETRHERNEIAEKTQDFQSARRRLI